MATYANDLRLKEITPGDEDGTWGGSTNTNWDLVAEAWGTGVLQLAADANETFTMSDGASSQVRSMYISVTSAGTLTATRTLTLAPSTLNKVWFIENNTTGNQSIIIKQGSGATVTIVNGDTKCIATDGAGAGGAVTELTIVSGLGTMSTQNASAVAITGGTITGITDLAVADGGTGASTAANARTNLGATTVGANIFTLTNPGAVTFLRMNADNTVTSLSAADMRTALGLGTIATQAASAVAITGGTITGITDLAVADGGTGASTAAGARSALGLGTMSTQNATAVAITGGSILTTTIGLTQASASISAGTLTLNLSSASYFTVSVGQNFTVEFSSVPTGRPVMFTVEFTNAGAYDFASQTISGYTLKVWDGQTLNLKPFGTTVITAYVRSTTVYIWTYWMDDL